MQYWKLVTQEILFSRLLNQVSSVHLKDDRNWNLETKLSLKQKSNTIFEVSDLKTLFDCIFNFFSQVNPAYVVQIGT